MKIEDKVYNKILELKSMDGLEMLASHIKESLILFKLELRHTLGESCNYIDDYRKLKKLLCEEKLDEEDAKEGTSN